MSKILYVLKDKNEQTECIKERVTVILKTATGVMSQV